MEKISQSAGEAKILQYVARIQAGESAESVLNGLPPGMRSAVEAKMTAPEAEALDLTETESQIGQWVDQEIVDFFSQDKTLAPDKLGHIENSAEAKLFLLQARDIFVQEKKGAKAGAILSVRQVVFAKMGIDALDTFDDITVGAKTRSMHGEMYDSLTDEKKQQFPEYQRQAAEIFGKLINGHEFADLTISNLERELIETLRIDAGGLDEREQIIYENFIQRVSFKISSGEIQTETPRPISKAETLSESIPAQSPETAPTKSEGRKNWQEVQRSANQEAFGDLNGSFESFIAHLTQRGLIETINGKIEWRGGNTKVVFVGDILGDRHAQGMKVMEALADLNTEAQKQGGAVESLAGNHDNMFNAVLGGFDVETKPAHEDHRIFMYSGNLEGAFYTNSAFKEYVISRFRDAYANKKLDLETARARKERIVASFAGRNDINPEVLETFRRGIDDINKVLIELENLNQNINPDNQDQFFIMLKYLDYKDAVVIGQQISQNHEAVLANMKNSPQGLKRLEAICSQKIATFHDDTLYTHTNLTHEMTQEILKGSTIEEGIRAINASYQKGLRHFLLGEGQLTAEEMTKFHEIKMMFLSTSGASRINFSEDKRLSADARKANENALRDKGVNLVIHGHNDEKGEKLGTSDLPIISIDQSVYKFDESWGRDKPVATFSIDRQGNAKSAEANLNVRQRN